ncbi:alanine dehydrogenase [Streptomyces sp. SAI-135]|uniref:ornithine cyclodeaminase family protein n=1 Tax=unclassified Streptomyces TaxID=2593676 RepID=UPI00247635E7|nr:MULTISPECIES: ornithine cyclodeaminase family protein [unclassified Streptomyces]MDH6515337.1 alanine dehydrogenase [Streptomyces sp. SAI-090]MDH6547550.1 alanine dehydrogenase [Streptomyces sp. SAI-041]MDH6566635.1 alanine dehydrogenase [Streptomyces sp. SAI-117]MDH6620577.1 alanine dehydrogenase [Streptomyces sp. SAI-135]
MTDDVLFLSGEQVTRLLDADTAIASQRAAFTALGAGTADLPAKIMHPSRFDDSVVFAYVSRLSADSGAVAKFGSVNPGNAAAGLPTIHAVVTVLDPVTGRLAAVLDGAAVTTARTAAASAVAVDALATPDSTDLAVLGSGTQALAHVRAIARVRDLKSVRLWSPTPHHRARAAGTLADLGLPVEAAGSAEEAVTGASLVAACTLSTTPVVRGEWLAPGCTVVSVGSFEPTRREVDAEVLRRAVLSGAVVVDDPATAAEHAGPVVDALRTGLLTDLVGLGDVLTGRAAARTAPGGIVYYNSVGLGIQDAAAAWAVVRAAREERA